MIRKAKRRLRQFISDVLRRELHVQSRSIDVARSQRLALEAAAFVEDHMGYAKGFSSRYDLLSASLGEVDRKLNGLYCEFGVFEGRTINFIAEKVDCEVHGFDSFEGLPEDWRPGVMRGAFKMGGALPAVRDNVRIHPGWFKDSLPRFAREHRGPLAFAHIDSDLYSSTKTILDVLGSRIVPGTVIQFDEFFNFSGWKDGEYRAFTEFCNARAVTVRYIGYTISNSPAQIALSVLSLSG
jgi:hypothetical protein